VLPLFPLLAAGLVEELEHLAKMLWAGFRHREVGQRVVAGIIAIAAVAIFGTAAAMQGYVTLVFLHQSAQEKSAKLHDLKEAYSWISTNLPASATMLAYDDPLLYLYTGWRGNYLPLLPRWWYAEDHAAMIGAYRDLANYCRNRGLDYVLFTSQDLSREVGEEDRQAIERVVRENPRLKPVYQGGIVTVYKMED
jgi:hypothetical protein